MSRCSGRPGKPPSPSPIPSDDHATMSISGRKRDHVDITLGRDVAYRVSAGFERVRFRHQALPEIDLQEVDTTSRLLDRSFPFPLFISSMTGGYDGAGDINALIAEFAQHNDLPFGVGSQRVMLEDPSTAASFRIVRDLAPDAFICANIGGAQLIGGLPASHIASLIDSIRADAIIVHLNPLQELLQPDGDHAFRGVLAGIERLVADSPVPVIAKETGAGIDGPNARRLLEAGVRVIDVAGAGGTSWSRVEQLREDAESTRDFLSEWGTSTVDCLLGVVRLRESHRFDCIASGGIRGPEHMLKSICLGADFAAAAQPVLALLDQGGLQGLQAAYEMWTDRFRKGMVLLGARTVAELREKKVYLLPDEQDTRLF